MTILGRRALSVGLAAGLAIGLVLPVASPAAGKTSGMRPVAQRTNGVSRRVHVTRSEGYRDLYTDGPGSSFGFHPGPGVGPYPSPARLYRARQAYSLRETMAIDQLTRGHGYGSPFYAGYYGPGTGYETGLGRSY